MKVTHYVTQQQKDAMRVGTLAPCGRFPDYATPERDKVTCKRCLSALALRKPAA